MLSRITTAQRSMTAPTMMKLLLVLLLAVSLATAAALEDTNEKCQEWAERGECEKNPGYMQSNCAASCDAIEEARLADMKELEGLSFFDLKAKDIDGNDFDFASLKGKVTVIVNVASFCGYTESHYRGLVELYSNLEGTPVEILAFPCNQFGKQEPESNENIKAFAENKGAKFTMMDKVNVNGPDASIVYKFLKKEAGPANIGWNFATYFVVSPEGDVESFNGVEPMELKDNVLGMLEGAEL